MADPVMDLVLYMSQINKDIEYLDSNPHSFKHAKRLLEEECDRIRHQLYNFDEFALEPLELPEGTGQKIVVRYKIYFPVEDSNFNFVGRLLGPKGETIKQMEKDTKCRIVLRGKGIKNNTRLTRQSRYSDFDEDRPHVLLSIKTFENIAFKLMDRAAAHVLKVINPTIGDDEFKRRQLIHNAILNGEYRGPRIRELTPGDMRAQNLLGNSMLSKGVFVSNIIEDQEEAYQDGRELENIYPVMSPKEQQRFNQLYYMNIQQQALAPDYQFYPSLPNKAREINDQCHSSLPFERQVKYYQSHPSLPIGALGLNHQTHPSLPIETLGLNYQSHSSLPTEALELNYQPHPSLPTEAQKYHSSIFKTHEPINRFHPSPPNEEQGPSNQFHHYSPFEKLIPNYEFNLPTSSDDEDPSPNTPYYHFHSSSPIESSEEESDCLNYPLFYTPSILYEAQESSQPISSLSAEAHPYYPYQLRNLPVPQASINYLYYN